MSDDNPKDPKGGTWATTQEGMEELALQMIRNVPKPTDRIPDRWQWNVILALHNIDKRLQAIEEQLKDA